MYTYDYDYDTILANTKCNNPRERPTTTVRIGERYRAYCFGEFAGIVTITAENRERIEREINDPENDITSYRKTGRK